MPIPTDLRSKPLDVKVHVSSGAGIDIIWADGHACHFDFLYLRYACPCASCSDERRKKQEAKFQAPATSGAELPLFKPKPRARSAKTVGNYALQIEFSDGHSTGIYSYDYLRSICPCERSSRASSTD